MCGRYTLTRPEVLTLRFDLAEPGDSDLAPRFNVAPSQQVAVVVAGPAGRTVRLMRWGYRPAWMRDGSKRLAPINARAETLLERPLFRGALATHRCLIPADGFYEWAAVPGSKARQPMFFHLGDGQVFGFAGIYADGGSADANEATCAIVTTTANALLAPIHDRMPVILDPSDEALWLDPAMTDSLQVLPCLRPLPAEHMVGFPVSSLVSSVRNEGHALIAPLRTP